MYSGCGQVKSFCLRKGPKIDMAFNPNAVFISPSSLGDLEKCPQLYYYRNVYRTQRGMKIQITNGPLALGGLVHDVIEQFMKLEPGDRKKAELDRLTEFLWQNIAGEKGGFKSYEEEKEDRERAQSMIDRFWANEQFRSATGAKIPNFPKVELGNDIILTGKLDWVQNEGDGYLIIDFKTGKNKEKEDSYQLPIYALLVSEIFKTNQIIAKYWYLDTDEPMEEVALPGLKAATELMKQKGEIVKMVRQTNSYKCKSGGESCWACRDFLAVARGKGKLVTVDMNRKQEIYILQKEPETIPAEPAATAPPFEELPF